MNSKQIKAIRDSMGLSQQKFGELVGYKKKFARNRISELERGVVNISSRIELICKLLTKKK